MDCVKMVQYHNLGSLACNSEYFGHTRPWKSGPNLISSERPFFQNGCFLVWEFSLEKRVVFIGMRVTLWKLFIINRAENKRLYIYQYFSFGFKNCRTSKYFFKMIFEYFVFSTVYIQNVFSGLHPYTYITLAKKKKQKVRHRADFEADLWPEPGDFFRALCWFEITNST